MKAPGRSRALTPERLEREGSPLSVRALCLAGPTAAGKSAVALALARELAVEIISVDSAQVYRGMDIGTAKPTAAERAAVPHHLIDLVDPAESYSAARFAADAERLIEQIRARGRWPLLTGGTMLYFKALREGIDPMPESNPAVRAEIAERARCAGWPALHAELAAVDPATAARLEPGDAQRIQRALEVWRISGKPLSAWQTGAARPARADLPLVSLEPASRTWLHERIAARLDAMLDAGFVDEVRALRARGDLHAALPALRCVGYRQAWAALDAGDLAPLRGTAIAATRQLAKRQLTWLRGMRPHTVIEADAPGAPQRAVRSLLQLVGQDAR
jgi:tRNA dimethylallyltransferase